MNRRSVLWILPYFVAAIIWFILYNKVDSLVNLYYAGRQNPLVFILIVGMFLHLVVGIIREWRSPSEE
jgi:hypothetical protein